jgi:hypothetical protein
MPEIYGTGTSYLFGLSIAASLAIDSLTRTSVLDWNRHGRRLLIRFDGNGTFSSRMYRASFLCNVLSTKMLEQYP